MERVALKFVPRSLPGYSPAGPESDPGPLLSRIGPGTAEKVAGGLGRISPDSSGKKQRPASATTA